MTKKKKWLILCFCYEFHIDTRKIKCGAGVYHTDLPSKSSGRSPVCSSFVKEHVNQPNSKQDMSPHSAPHVPKRHKRNKTPKLSLLVSYIRFCFILGSHLTSDRSNVPIRFQSKLELLTQCLRFRSSLIFRNFPKTLTL